MIACRSRDQRSLEYIENSRNGLHQLKQRWNNRLTPERIVLSEGYMNGGLALVCDFQIINPCEKTGLPTEHRSDGEIVKCRFSAFHADAVNLRNCKAWDKQFMLIGNVQIVKSAKSLVPSTIFVWPYLIHDQVNDVGSDSLYKSTINSVYKFLPRIIKREFGVLSLDVSIMRNNVAHHMVKSAPGVMDRVSNNGGGDVRREILSHLQFQEALTSLSILIDNDSVEVTVAKGSQLSIQVSDVMVGPFDF